MKYIKLDFRCYNINYDKPDPDYLYDLWRDLKYEEKTL